jgi:hypothetical protein
MQLFRQCLEDCDLVDLGFIGPKYTWTNKQDVETNVRVRLDRAVANGTFSARFDDCRVENIVTTTSDHLALLITVGSFESPASRPPVQGGFRFEAAWLRAPDYKDLMEQTWTKGSGTSASLQATCNKLRSVAVSLRQWSRDTFGSVQKQIKKLERQLLYLRTGPCNAASLTETRDIERKLCELFKREEIIARQRSRVDWLKEGDRNRNTAFFHARASARRRANTIKLLKREDGSKCDQLPAIKGMVEHFYGELFTSEPCGATEVVLDSIQTKVTDDMNADLCKPYSDEEIKNALFQMGPTKAPGPDGFPALFYQTHWDFFKEDICAAVRGFLNGDVIPEGLCDSVIVLIPKVQHPNHLKNFRPISLCNVLYKIASKVLANRLKVLLPIIISEY